MADLKNTCIGSHFWKMKIIVNRTECLRGSVLIPGSKSHSIRWMLFALMAKGESKINNVLTAADSEAAKNICQAFCSKIEEKDGSLLIKSAGLPLSKPVLKVHSGNSGITTRFLLPILGLRSYPESIILEVGEQMKNRPIAPLVKALNQLGMNVSDSFPLHISGNLEGGHVEIEGSTSQYLSALLMALPSAPNDSYIKVKDLREVPYVKMTLACLDELGIKYKWEGDEFFVPGRQKYSCFTKNIPGDFSSASYFYAAQALLPGNIKIEGLDQADEQADKALLSFLENWPEEINCMDCPDLLPTLAVIATSKTHPTYLMNVEQARIKETDRIHSMTEGLRLMGAKIEEKSDGLIVYPSKLKGAEVHGFYDHRTIMALSVAGLIAEGKTIIDSAEGIYKTFPNFVELMQGLGAQITLEK